MDIDLEALRRRLLDRAFLYDDPASYVGGVEQALAAVGRWTRPGSTQQPAQSPADRHLTPVRDRVS